MRKKVCYNSKLMMSATRHRDDDESDHGSKRRRIAGDESDNGEGEQLRSTDRHDTGDHFSTIHGSAADSKALEEVLNQYSKTDWTLLADNILQSNLDTDCSDRDLIATFHMFYKLFCHPFTSEYAVIDRLGSVYPSVTGMKDSYKRIQRIFGSIYFELIKRNMVNEEERSGREVQKMLTMISFYMKTSFEQLVLTRMMQHGSDTMTRSMLEEMTPEVFYQEHDLGKLKKHQQIIYFYLNKAFRNNYKKAGDSLYQPRYNKRGDFVHAYEYVCDISDFVLQGIFPLEQNHYYFDCLTEKPGTVRSCIEHLTKFKTEWLQDLERNPFIHGFQNGLFHIEHNEFYHFNKIPGKRWVGELDGITTALKYHDIEFDEDGMEADMNQLASKTYMSIEMAPIKKILATQEFDVDEQQWIFCLLGRLLYPVGHWDTWAVFPYFLGLAGTGKSTCLRLVADLFEKRDVGYLNNTLQKTFALEGICDCMLYLALDIDGDFQLDQTTFQSMVCGEEVSIIRKFKQPVTKIWTIHGGFAGNKLPSWTDNGGSLSRRLVLIEFTRSVKKCDPNLFEKCLSMKDRFLKVIVSAYFDLTCRYSKRGIKEVIPDKFKKSEKKALLELNCLLQFVNDKCEVEECEVGAKHTMVQGFKEFQAAFRQHCKDSDIKSKTLNYTFYNGVFAKYQIQVVETKDIKPSDAYNQKLKYILGLRLKDIPDAS